MDVITNISPRKTPLFSGLGRSKASNTLHQWLTDGLAASADNANAESSDASVADLTQPVRAVNITQIFRKVVTVSDTEQAVNIGGMKDPYAYQMNKLSAELAKDVEKALVAGTIASGSTGVARRMKGVISWISTNLTARTTGTSLSETEFNDIQQAVWNNTDEAADEIYVGAYLKRAISGYTAGNTKNVDANDKRLVNAVDVYESDFGLHKVFAHREVPVAAGSAGILALNSKLWKVAVLRPIKHTPLAKTGNYEKGMIEGELTLESLNEAGSAYRKGYFVG